MRTTPSNCDDQVDSRDIVERIEELEGERDAYNEDSHPALWSVDCADDAEELKTLQAIVEEIDQNAGDNARDGVQLIRDSYFVDAMQELMQDIGDLPRNIPTYLEIDWDKTAENLRADYTSLDWDGVEYWFR